MAVGKIEQHRIYPYLLRHLAIERPDQVWCADVTYIPMQRGFLYLVAIMDWFSRKVLTWRLSNTMDADFCVVALEEAIARHGRRNSAPPRPIKPPVSRRQSRLTSALYTCSSFSSRHLPAPAMQASPLNKATPSKPSRVVVKRRQSKKFSLISARSLIAPRAPVSELAQASGAPRKLSMSADDTALRIVASSDRRPASADRFPWAGTALVTVWSTSASPSFRPAETHPDIKLAAHKRRAARPRRGRLIKVNAFAARNNRQSPAIKYTGTL